MIAIVENSNSLQIENTQSLNQIEEINLEEKPQIIQKEVKFEKVESFDEESGKNDNSQEFKAENEDEIVESSSF
jgi:hypothetical protein